MVCSKTSQIRNDLMLRNLQNSPNRKIGAQFVILLFFVFMLGGITRQIQLMTNLKWLEGIVDIFVGLFLSLWGFPFWWRLRQGNLTTIKRIIIIMAGILITGWGLPFIFLGAARLTSSLR